MLPCADQHHLLEIKEIAFVSSIILKGWTETPGLEDFEPDSYVSRFSSNLMDAAERNAGRPTEFSSLEQPVIYHSKYFRFAAAQQLPRPTNCDQHRHREHIGGL